MVASKLWNCAFELLPSAEQMRPNWCVAEIRKYLFFGLFTQFMRAHTQRKIYRTPETLVILCLSYFQYGLVIGFFECPEHLFNVNITLAVSLCACFLAFSLGRSDELKCCWCFCLNHFRLVDFSFPLPPHYRQKNEEILQGIRAFATNPISQFLQLQIAYKHTDTFLQILFRIAYTLVTHSKGKKAEGGTVKSFRLSCNHVRISYTQRSQFSTFKLFMLNNFGLPFGVFSCFIQPRERNKTPGCFLFSALNFTLQPS